VGQPWFAHLSFKQFVKRLYQAYVDNNVADSGAILSYYFVFSLFPFLFFLVTLAAYLPFVSSATSTLLSRAHGILPGPAMSLVNQHVQDVVSKPRPHLLGIGILVTLYSASRGVDAVRRALNLAYDVKESRPFWKTELIAFGMTAGGALLVLLSIAALLAGGHAGFWIAHHFHIGEVYQVTLSWLRWPITALAIMFAAALAYYLLPDVEQQFRFITPGSVIGTIVWFGAAVGFAFYVGHFASYNATYGSIGGVIVLLTWFYLTGLIFLLGGETNAIIEHAAPDGKRDGARAPGESPPPKEDRPSAAPPGATKSANAAARSEGGTHALP
jgi:membrane protein